MSDPRPFLSGSLDQLSVPDLLQTAEANRRSGVIQVRNHDKSGTFWLRDGRVVDAEVTGELGAEAVYEMVVWEEGRFEADFTAVTVAEKIFQPTSALLLEGMRRRDERLRDAPPPHAALQDPPPPPPPPLLALHRGLMLLNVAASYASEHVEPELLGRRLEAARSAILADHPALDTFRVSPGGAVAALPEAPLTEVETMVNAVSRWLTGFFVAMENALPGRFPLRKLRQITEAVQDDLESLGYYRELGFAGPRE